jgi:hypothetical protein
MKPAHVVSVLARGGNSAVSAAGGMPQYLEPGARMSERWSPGGPAKVEVQGFTQADRGPDERRENGAG